MESRPVSFETYGAVAFRNGSVSSIMSLVRALFSKRFPHRQTKWKTIRIFTAMIAATLYIAAMPTLFSAMTGYAAVASPLLKIGYPGSTELADDLDPDGSLQYPCDALNSGSDGYGKGGFLEGKPCLKGSNVQRAPLLTELLRDTGFGVCKDCNRTGYTTPYYIPTGVGDPLEACEWSHINRIDALTDEPRDYNKYKEFYDAAAIDPSCQKSIASNNTVLDDCPPLARSSSVQTYADSPNYYQFESPLLDI